MILAIISALIGIALIYLEFFMPGAIFGAIGALFILSSIVVFGMTAVPFYSFFIFLICLVCLVFITLRSGLNRTKKVISLKGDQAGYVASSFDVTLIGKQGIVLSDLKPSGHIQIDQNSYQAVSESLYINKGTPIIVTGGRGSYLIVKESSLS